MSHATLNITAYREASLTIARAISLGGSAVNLTGYATTDLTAYVGKPSGILSTLTIGSGITIDDAAAGEITITFSSTVTDIEPGNYTFELFDFEGSDDVLIARGTFTVLPSLRGLA